LDKRIDAATKDVQTAITQTAGLPIDPRSAFAGHPIQQQTPRPAGYEHLADFFRKRPHRPRIYHS
jgi:hypothetical protein